MEELDVNVSSSEGFGVAGKIVLLSFVSAVILMAILGNLLVMVAVCRDRQLRKIKTNYFIVSLAFADLLVSVLVMPFGAIELVQDNWIYGEMFCLVRTSLDVLLTTASILHLCCISLDRYYAICCQPLVYRNKMTPLRIAVMLGGCWVIPTFISFLPIMQGWNSIGIIDLIQQRQFNKASNSTYCIFMVNKPYAITCSVVAFYIPFLLMVLAYHRIYVTARAHARQIQLLQRAGNPAEPRQHPQEPRQHPQEPRQHPQEPRQHPPDQHSTHRMKTETKAAKTLCIIMGCFCLCWAPFFVTNIVDPFINYTVPGKLWTAFLWLGYINSGLNPFLYAFLNKAFRRAFLIILCCGDERYRRPSILGQTVPCSTTTINGSTHVLSGCSSVSKLLLLFCSRPAPV
ncbi:5-hydroxytryptamine receptor 4 isoform X2 [Cyanistes caeruleus]|uniref:5-hydroxytryptamine receptor 4 isoform X2 n=1 Tax=Cyanistes caeruleus TaxID=156563 RepID=UPI000CDACDBF|nr:5-hydroxytryptamine receptor 4 isoform X2 [Cyanistes caeruleus]